MSLPEHPSLSALEDAPLEPRKIGGKAAALGTLLRRGVAMPVTWVLDTAPFRDVVETELPSEHEPRALLKLKKPLARLERAAQARQRLLEAPPNEALEQALAALWRRLEPVAPWGLAVRASPSVDDDSEASMAGLTGAVLGVRGGPALAAAVRQLWALAFSPRALVYLAQRKVRDLAMAVVFQPVVIADVSGVLATRPPTGPLAPRERQGERLVNAWWGLAPWVEGGDAALDVVRLSANGDVIEQRLADKPLRLVVSSEGTSWGEVAPELRQRSCLDGTRRRSLAALAHRLDALDEGGDGYEAAFAFVGDRLLLLQAQRGRGVGFPEGGGEQTVWSRTTVTESLSGVVSPLTLSLSEPFVEESFRHTFERLGSSVPDDRLIASVHGRAYLNLSALLRMAVQLPGLDAHAVVQLAGVEATEALERQLHDVSRRGFYTRLPLTAARQIAEQGAIGTLVEQAEALAVDAERAVEEIDLVILPDDALVIRLRELRELLGRATTVLATVTTAYVTSHLALSATIGRSAPVGADRLAAVLSAGVIGLE
ncbi:MAG: phosphoenolpyruvate synthase, partial [Myxococcales bacterium]